MTEVVLVEDDPAHERWLRQCIARLPQARVTGCARSLAGALAVVTDPAVRAPDLLLLDLRLPDGLGLDLLPQVRRWWRRSRVLVVSQLGDDRLVVQALRQGAQGYLMKEGDATAVTEALQAVLRGLYTLSPGVARQLLTMGRPRPAALPKAVPAGPADEPLDLTGRERDVLEALSQGMTYGEVAVALCLSVSTVQSHVRNLYRKLGATSRLGALQRATSLGLFSTTP